MTSRRAGLTAAGLVAAVLLTGCSGGDDDPTPSPSTTPTASTSPTAATTSPRTPPPIVPTGTPPVVTPSGSASPSARSGLPVPIPSDPQN